MVNYLKGEDARVYRVCRELRVQPLLQLIYDDAESRSELGIMVDRSVKDPDYDPENSSYGEYLLTELGGIPVNKTQDAVPYDRGDSEGELITWVSPFNGRNKLEDTRIAYGNEFTTDFIYCSPCIIVRIPAAYDRV